MGVDHRSGYIGVAEQFLNGADVIATLQQMCGKRMAQGMRRGGLDQAGIAHCLLHGALLRKGSHASDWAPTGVPLAGARPSHRYDDGVSCLSEGQPKD